MLNSTQPHGLPICDILGLYHVLMYVCRLHWFVVQRFFCLYGLPTYVECLYRIPTNVESYDFMACIEFLRKKLKHFIPIKNKMLQYSW